MGKMGKTRVSMAPLREPLATGKLMDELGRGKAKGIKKVKEKTTFTMVMPLEIKTELEAYANKRNMSQAAVVIAALGQFLGLWDEE